MLGSGESRLKRLGRKFGLNPEGYRDPWRGVELGQGDLLGFYFRTVPRGGEKWTMSQGTMGEGVSWWVWMEEKDRSH